MAHEHRQQYTCPMHPEVIKDGPGKCPKCGMALTPLQELKQGDLRSSPSQTAKAE